jgi:hypothetical protein
MRITRMRVAMKGIGDVQPTVKKPPHRDRAALHTTTLVHRWVSHRMPHASWALLEAAPLTWEAPVSAQCWVIPPARIALSHKPPAST